jgi:hypothetical protein
MVSSLALLVLSWTLVGNQFAACCVQGGRQLTRRRLATAFEAFPYFRAFAPLLVEVRLCLGQPAHGTFDFNNVFS